MAVAFAVMRAFLLAFPAALLAGFLQGCDIYMNTCVWHSDLNIKGCDYFGYRHCIQNCHYCITGAGPQECDQLKCAAYCANKESDKDCLRNFKSLCDIAIAEGQNNTDLKYCDVQCSAASSTKPSWLLGMAVALLGLQVGGSRATLMGACLAFLALSLTGCYCTEPQPQLQDTVDTGELNGRTRRTENGIWRGVPSWRFGPEFEAEEYHCKKTHSTKSICTVWTSKEWNCDEEDFGTCKCYELSDNGNYCKAWGCHSLEADQKICHHSQNSDTDSQSSSESCQYHAFPMNEAAYMDLLRRQEGGVLTTGEFSNIWGYSSFRSNWRRLEEGKEDEAFRDKEERGFTEEQDAALRELFPATLGHQANESTERRLQPRRLTSWPPLEAYQPRGRHHWFHWNDVCIVNGDNVLMAKMSCNSWREIETEISHCVCKTEHSQGKACQTWTCEERDVGLFSVLFRTRQEISQYVKGAEKEEYTCTSFNIQGECTSWTGDIRSEEEVEWTTCECIGSSCNSDSGRWRCDEYELPVTRDLLFEEYRGTLFSFFMVELCVMCAIARGATDNDSSGDAMGAAVVFGSCVGIILLPFIVVTFGLYGWLLVSLPWWTCRIAGCCCFIMKDIKMPDMPDFEKPTNRQRLKRGASRLIGKKSEKVAPVAPEVTPTNEPTNEPDNEIK